jgi:hypothetical protein
MVVPDASRYHGWRGELECRDHGNGRREPGTRGRRCADQTLPQQAVEARFCTSGPLLCVRQAAYIAESDRVAANLDVARESAQNDLPGAPATWC